MKNLIIAFSLLFAAALPQRATAQSLVINEVMAANLGEVIDPSWNFGGWIELYNPSTRAVSLNGMAVRDHKGRVFLLTKDHGSVPAGGFRNVWFGHHDKNFPAQVDFKLDCDGGSIALLASSASNAAVVDAVNYPAAISRTSWARISDGAEQWTSCAWPTPEASNPRLQEATARQLPAPVPSLDGGWIEGTTSFTVAVDPDADLHYTTDGSCPVASSPKATKNADGTADFSVSKNTVYRFRALPRNAERGLLPSPVVTRSFLTRQYTKTVYVDPWGWDDWGGGGWVDTREETTSFDGFSLLSVVTDPDYLYDDEIGIYVDGTNGGWSYWGYANYYQDWDRPVNVEIFDPEGLPMVNQEVDMCMSGGYSRMSDPKSFKLKSDKKFEHSNYFPLTGLFAEKPYVRSKDVLVRVGGSSMTDRHLDNALQAIVRRSGFYLNTQASRPVYVFFNGEYVETLFLREPSNKQYGASNYGMDTDLMDTLEESDITALGVASGSRDAFDVLCSAARECANDDAQWARVCRMLDVDEFANYFALETYLANQDWPQNNIKMFRENADETADFDDGEGTAHAYHVVLQDLDACFHETGDTFSRIDDQEYYYYASAGRQENVFLTLFFNLMKREEFRRRFVDAFCLVAGSVLEPTTVKEDLDVLSSVLTSGYVEKRSEAQSALAIVGSQLSDSWRQKRLGYLRKWQRAGLSKARSITATIALEGAGDGSRSAALFLNGQPIPRSRFSGTLFLPVELKAPKVCGRQFAGWTRNGVLISSDETVVLDTDGDYRAEYTEDAEYAGESAKIVVNEVSADNGIYQSARLKRSDWIELYNATDETLDLAGLYISDDIRAPYKFQIPTAGGEGTDWERPTTIAPHGHYVLWADDHELPFKLKNADNSCVVITSQDGSWSNVLYYHAMDDRQSVGHWPDGGEDVYLFDRPSIDGGNVYTSYARRLDFDPVVVGLGDDVIAERGDQTSNGVDGLFDALGRRIDGVAHDATSLSKSSASSSNSSASHRNSPTSPRVVISSRGGKRLR